MSNPEQIPVLNEAGETKKAGCVVIDTHGRMLLSKDSRYVYWSLPKGHAEVGETLEETAARETLEESGWEVRIEKSLGEFRYAHPITKEAIALTIFLASPIKYTRRGEEHSDWFSPDVIKSKLYPNLVRFLQTHHLLP